ncbi:MAG TPA: hypothetical protein VKB70_07935 [Gaiellaceae bacterium]|nr:hypothetical protein [Gaiellaceae bacterium]
MPKVVLTHAVVDVDRWLKGKADRAAALGRNVVDYVAEDGSTNIAITAEVDDLPALQAMLAAPPAEVQAQMDEHGVVPPVTTYVEA